jgi:hypothetical protein
MTGAEHECPYHPHHPARFERARIRDLAALHSYAPLPRIITKPTINTATAPTQAAIIMVIS